MSARRGTSLALVAIGVALIAALLVAARPREVVALAATARPAGLLVAFAWAMGVLLLRGIRLALVGGPRLGVPRATQVVAVSQLAIAVLPMRLGELALVPLLHAVGVTGVARGLSFAVALRILDLAALLLWAAVAVALLGTPPALVAMLAAVVLGLVAALGWGQRGMRRLVRRHRHGRPTTRRLVRQLLQARRELRAAARSPVRLGGIAVASIGIWAGLWGLTAALLAAMGRPWPAGAVLAGVVGAAVGTALPINAVGNFGTLEAGWTGALVAAGVPAGDALAAGFATHLWSLAFSAVGGGVALGLLLVCQPAVSARWRREIASSSRALRRDE